MATNWKGKAQLNSSSFAIVRPRTKHSVINRKNLVQTALSTFAEVIISWKLSLTTGVQTKLLDIIVIITN